MNATELLAIFREEVRDLELPYLWSDALVYGYIDDAQKQFCRDTFGIEDSRSFKLSITATNEWYAIDPTILRLLSATDSVTGDEIPIQSIDQTISAGIVFNGKTGKVNTLINGMQKGFLRAYPVPNDVSTVLLRTLRLPNDIDAGDDFEIDPQHHRNLLYWVKFRAYSVPDSDGSDKNKADANEKKFDAYCLKAKTEQGRLRRKVAVVSYQAM
jgi:hypothetical protein